MVTGGTGFVGSHSVRALVAAGHDVRLLIRDRDKLARVFAPFGIGISDFVVGDVGDEASVAEALRGCDAVVHAAASVTLTARDRRTLDANVRGVDLVIGGAQRRGIPSIVYVSSVGALFRPGGPPITADSPVVPGATPYARSKADCERSVRELQEAGAPIRTSYPTAVLGPDDPGLSQANHGIRAMIRDLFVVTSSGFQMVDVRDLAEAHVALVERDAGPGRYLVGGHFFPWEELADRIDALTGARVRRARIPGPLMRVAGRVGDLVKRVRRFDFPLSEESMAFATQWQPVDSAKTLAALGLAFRDPAETLADAVRWMARAGHLERRHAGRLADG